MARDFAKKFYGSKRWKKKRKKIYERDGGLCVKCGNPGKIVHHIIPLSPENIDDPNIAYGDDNLELVCEACHGILTSGERLMLFDENGQPIPPPVQKVDFF
ncbi:MAG: HNH endonuclease [Clostridia bacterium]|nr:HNH endonuclease [Clostridia bacterium]